MKISTEIYSAVKNVGIAEEKAIELYAKAGFDAWDFSMFVMGRHDVEERVYGGITHPLNSNDYLAFARRLKQVGLDNGIVCNQSHAPFPSINPDVRSCLKRAIECTAEAGANICIIHPCNEMHAEKNAEMFMELLPFAKECGVKIATENMWCWDDEKGHSVFAACATGEDFNAHLDAVNDEYLVACLDIGHAEMKGSGDGAANMIKALGSRLKALHIHDNDLVHDSHQIPFSMNINFDEVVGALKSINYDGYFTLEADNYLQAYNTDNAFDGMKNLAAAARKLADMFEKA